MRFAVLRKRRDHDTSFSGTAAVLALATLTALPFGSATAQNAVPCTAIADDDERLACYDRALRPAPPAPPAPAAAPAPAALPAAAPPAQAESRGAPSTAAPVVSTARVSPALPPRRERRVRESAAPTAPAAPVAGREAEAAEAVVPIVIVGVRTLLGRETTFTDEDGTSWVQTDSQRLINLPETPFDAEIRPGAMGSHFLVPSGHARAIRVRPRD